MEFEFGCTICGEGIEDSGVAIWLFPMGTEGTDTDVGQQYWAHGHCVAIAMHPTYLAEIRDELQELIKL